MQHYLLGESTDKSTAWMDYGVSPLPIRSTEVLVSEEAEVVPFTAEVDDFPGIQLGELFQCQLVVVAKHP
eukprot:5502648-Amphidinium_carterae.1